MTTLSAPSPHQQKLLKTFAGKLALELNRLAPEVTASVDYGMLSVPLVAMAVDVLKQRGLTREEIEAMVMQILERQFNSGASPILKIVR